MSLAGFFRMSYTHDTLIDGHLAQVIDRYSAIQFPLPPPDYGYTDPYITYEPTAAITQWEDGVVYLFSGTDWDTLYWFDADPGDHWYPAFVNDTTCQPLEVLDTGTIVIEGVPLRTLGVSGYTVMERIGCTWDMMMFCPNWLIDGPMGMRCYSDDELSYQLAQGPCEMLAGIGEQHDPGSPRPYPNPANGILHVVGPAPFTGKVLSMDGRVIRDLSSMDGTLDVSGISPGPYLLRLVDGRGAVRTLRFVKE
jgi:hypothetical protein